jgi:hypothetical protein
MSPLLPTSDQIPSEPLPSPRSDAQLMIDYLAASHEPCPLCGYILHGLQSDRCPECGSQLRLRVGLAEPRMAAYITTSVSWAVGFGATGLLNSIATAKAPSNWVREPWAVISLILMATSLTSLGATLIFTRRFRRMPWDIQRTVAALSAAMVTLALGAIVLCFDN